MATACPRSALIRAASRPAGPPPTTTTRRTGPALFGMIWARVSSRPVAGLCRLAMGRADTGPDLSLSPGGDLCDEMRIGDLSPGHSDHIDLAFRQGETRGRDVSDARGMEDGQPDLASERADRLDPGCKRRTHPRHVLFRKRSGRVHRSVNCIEEVDCARLLQNEGRPEAVLGVKATVRPLV